MDPCDSVWSPALVEPEVISTEKRSCRQLFRFSQIAGHPEAGSSFSSVGEKSPSLSLRIAFADPDFAGITISLEGAPVC
jgi:hypothetical protein